MTCSKRRVFYASSRSKCECGATGHLIWGALEKCVGVRKGSSWAFPLSLVFLSALAAAPETQAGAEGAVHTYRLLGDWRTVLLVHPCLGLCCSCSLQRESGVPPTQQRTTQHRPVSLNPCPLCTWHSLFVLASSDLSLRLPHLSAGVTGYVSDALPDFLLPGEIFCNVCHFLVTDKVFCDLKAGIKLLSFARTPLSGLPKSHLGIVPDFVMSFLRWGGWSHVAKATLKVTVVLNS